jgi:hypothetical protein
VPHDIDTSVYNTMSIKDDGEEGRTRFCLFNSK